ncbi:hypothetical protein Holit_00779 [Hollandina sp. SP2]
MGSGGVGDYSVMESLSAMTAGTGLRPDPTAFFVVIDLPKGIDPMSPRRPWRGNGWLAGTKNFEYTV